MSAVLSFDLKKGLHHLNQDDRWTVLTVYILHANSRNRCYPTMTTVAQMGANGNLNRATAAKKWLVESGALILVPYSKRVDDERRLPRRQHVYQLTGRFMVDGEQFNYLYLNPEIMPIDNFNGDNQSIPNRSKPKRKRFVPDGNAPILPADEPVITSVPVEDVKPVEIPVLVKPAKGQTFAEANPGLTPEQLAAISKATIAEHTQQSVEKQKWNTDESLMAEAVKTHLPCAVGKLITQYVHMLRGTAKKSGYAEWNFEPRTIWSTDIPKFIAWYKRTYTGMTVPQNAETLYKHLMMWVEAGKPDITRPAQTEQKRYQADWTPDLDALYADQYWTDDNQYLGAKKDGYLKYQAYRQQQGGMIPPKASTGAAPYTGLML